VRDTRAIKTPAELYNMGLHSKICAETKRSANCPFDSTELTRQHCVIRDFTWTYNRNFRNEWLWAASLQEHDRNRTPGASACSY